MNLVRVRRTTKYHRVVEIREGHSVPVGPQVEELTIGWAGSVSYVFDMLTVHAELREDDTEIEYDILDIFTLATPFTEAQYKLFKVTKLEVFVEGIRDRFKITPQL